MTKSELLRELLGMGFAREGTSEYLGAVRLGHPSVARGSVFVGDGAGVEWRRHTLLAGTGAFIIANGRSGGMTKLLTTLGVAETGRIPDPLGRKSPDDPYWREDAALRLLLAAMKARLSG